MERRVDDDISQREVDAAAIPVMPGQMEAVMLFIEVRDPQAFPAPVDLREAAGEEVPRCLRAIQLQRGFGTLMLHLVHVSDRRACLDTNRVRCEQELDPF